ncbi:MAG: hypothetical protein LAO20_22220 [Acidobacteriia bacterium]|nr:hypothetical protein [Terriglobia bacterium]
MSTKYLQLAALFLTASVAAGAQKPIHRSGNEWIQEIKGTLPANKIVRVRSTAGAIRVQGGNQLSISYVIREHVYAGSEAAARAEFKRLKFSTFNSAEGAILRADCEGTRQGYIDFEVHVPLQTAVVKLETQGGAVSANGIEGKVIASTGGGNIQLDQIGGGVSVSSAGGGIDIGRVGHDVDANTVAGNIRIASAGGKVRASSGGGNLNIGAAKVMTLSTGAGSISVTKCDGGIKAETGGGAVEVTESGGPAQIETSGGKIRVGVIHGGLRAETGSGPIVATLAPGVKIFSDSRLETKMGDIIVYVPDGLGVTIVATVDTARGSGITSEFSELKIDKPKERFGPRSMFAKGNLNGGGPLLHVHTTTGNIELKRMAKNE